MGCITNFFMVQVLKLLNPLNLMNFIVNFIQKGIVTIYQLCMNFPKISLILLSNEFASCSNILTLIIAVESHPNFTCDQCLANPIFGRRYLCFRCPDYNNCGICYRNGDHDYHQMEEVFPKTGNN